jgi:vacuolar-type H+-ATPase subunit E/Vma4
LYSDIDDNQLQRTILKGIKYLVNKDKFDKSLINIFENNKNRTYQNNIEDDEKFQTIDDYIHSSINSFEGDFAEILPLIYKCIYKDEKSRVRILNLINEVIDKNVCFVIFGLLRTIGKIKIVDKELFTKLLVNLIEKNENGQVAIYSLENFHYLYVNKFITKKQLVMYIKKCISFVKTIKDKDDKVFINNLGMHLFYHYLNEKDEIFSELLHEAIDSNNQVIYGILDQIFEQELHSKDKEKIKKSKQFILKFKNNEENNYHYTLSLTKMNGLNFIENDFNFIKNLAGSLHIKGEINNFIEYLQNEYHNNTSLLEKIFELLEELIQNIDSTKEIDYYSSELLIEFILELNTRTKSDEKKEDVLNLIDKFLISDRLRIGTKLVVSLPKN